MFDLCTERSGYKLMDQCVDDTVGLWKPPWPLEDKDGSALDCEAGSLEVVLLQAKPLQKVLLIGKAHGFDHRLGRA